MRVPIGMGLVLAAAAALVAALAGQVLRATSRP
jgi:pantoate kinase